MPRNKLDDLNNHLFEMLEMVKDGDMNLDQAKTATDIAGRIIDIHKVKTQQAGILVKAGYTRSVANWIDQPQLEAGEEPEIV